MLGKVKYKWYQKFYGLSLLSLKHFILAETFVIESMSELMAEVKYVFLNLEEVFKM